MKLTSSPSLTETPPEVELCTHIAKWLRERKWDCNEEPSVYLPGDRQPRYPDFVISRDSALGVVEAKAERDGKLRNKGLTMGVLEQGVLWKPYAKIVYLAVNEPDPLHRATHEVLAQELRSQGIGLLMRLSGGARGVHHTITAIENMKASVGPLIRAISGHRDVLPAGTAGGHRFRKTDRQFDWVHHLVSKEGGERGMEPKDVLRAMPELVDEEVRKAFKAAESGQIAGVRVTKIGGPRRLVLTVT